MCGRDPKGEVLVVAQSAIIGFICGLIVGMIGFVFYLVALK